MICTLPISKVCEAESTAVMSPSTWASLPDPRDSLTICAELPDTATVRSIRSCSAMPSTGSFAFAPDPTNWSCWFPLGTFCSVKRPLPSVVVLTDVPTTLTVKPGMFASALLVPIADPGVTTAPVMTADPVGDGPGSGAGVCPSTDDGPAGDLPPQAAADSAITSDSASGNCRVRSDIGVILKPPGADLPQERTMPNGRSRQASEIRHKTPEIW